MKYSKTVKIDTDGSFTGNLKVSRQVNKVFQQHGNYYKNNEKEAVNY